LLKREAGGATGGAGAVARGGTGGAAGAGAAARGSTGGAAGADGSTWEGVEGTVRGGCATGGAFRGAEKPGGGGRDAGPAGLRGQSTDEVSSGNSDAACGTVCRGASRGRTDVPAEGEGAGRGSSLVRKSSSSGGEVRCPEKGKVVSSKMT